LKIKIIVIDLFLITKKVTEHNRSNLCPLSAMSIFYFYLGFRSVVRVCWVVCVGFDTHHCSPCFLTCNRLKSSYIVCLFKRQTFSVASASGFVSLKCCQILRKRATPYRHQREHHESLRLHVRVTSLRSSML